MDKYNLRKCLHVYSPCATHFNKDMFYNYLFMLVYLMTLSAIRRRSIE